MLHAIRAAASSSPVAIALLIGSNLVPLIGVLFFGWSLILVLVLYWIESGVVGLINVFKIAQAAKPAAESSVALRFTNLPTRNAASPPRGCLIPFFVFHYGIFWLVHGLFVFTLPLFALFGVEGIRPSGADRFGLAALTPTALGIGTLAVVLSHLGSYLYNFIGRREYLRVSPGEQMFRPYGRVVVMHLTILGGAFLIARFGMPVAALAVMVVVKTAIDLLAHLAEHRRAAASAPVAGEGTGDLSAGPSP